MPTDFSFDTYGFQFNISGHDAAAAVSNLANDFAFFERPEVTPALRVHLMLREPPYDEVPAREASVYTPRNISFTQGDRTYVDYSGKGLAIYDRSQQQFHMYSTDADLLYEATYLFLLSRIGEKLDATRMHRVHAMALGYAGRAVLAILPMGGGKSTLGAELLKCPDFSFLSDDSPFISQDGRVHAFPLRLGLLPGWENEIPPEHRRVINRMEFGPKILVNYSFFGSRVQSDADPGIVFLGRRSLARECRIERASAKEAYSSMIADCVVGLGLYQGLEFVLRRSPVELASKASIGWSRFRNVRRLFQRSEVYRLVLGRDRAQNGRAVTEFVRSRLK